eukprot:CAMPEP_0194077686 /NCGR_PEP_ID=MMETSP0149-20130528/4273_1 /TAXON_ID=122233 /ORGANISM="Chaetoceros debilis, Strain MM31A-1" /LENGTH=846 /DNA_ID=CAMNT_0038758787 /DNA_START=241 /DNA_END=2778 /DNA_ORIENTATION=+
MGNETSSPGEEPFEDHDSFNRRLPGNGGANGNGANHHGDSQYQNGQQHGASSSEVPVGSTTSHSSHGASSSTDGKHHNRDQQQQQNRHGQQLRGGAKKIVEQAKLVQRKIKESRALKQRQAMQQQQQQQQHQQQQQYNNSADLQNKWYQQQGQQAQYSHQQQQHAQQMQYRNNGGNSQNYEQNHPYISQPHAASNNIHMSPPPHPLAQNSNYRMGSHHSPLPHPQHQQQQQQHPTMNFMYTQQSTTPGQKPHPSMSPRGKVGNTMKQLGAKMGNMNLKGKGIQQKTNSHKHSRSSMKSDEARWEVAWEEDADDEEEDYDVDVVNTLGPSSSVLSSATGRTDGATANNNAVISGGMTNHFIMRPALDGAHSSSISPLNNNTGAAASLPSSSQLQSRPTSSSSQARTQLFGEYQYRNIQVPHKLDPAEKLLNDRCDKVLQGGENGIRWDMDQSIGVVGNEGTHNDNADSAGGAVPDSGYEKPNLMNFLPLLRVLGKGSFGKVVLVQKRTGLEKGGLFAMKMLKKTHLLKRGQIERTRTERKVLSVVDHPFIMKLHFAFQTDEKLFLVLDYCAGGELFFHLSRYRRFPEKFTRLYAAELLLALGYLHSKGIIYRDLKPENVLLDSDGHVKLGDFGLAKANIKHPCKGAQSMCGTPEYMSPEVLLGLGHGFCVDYWGLGMLTYEMMTGLPPWYTTDREKLYQRLRSAPLVIPSFFSPQVSDCIAGLLQRNPRQRLGVRGKRSVMAHDFFRGLDFREVIARRVQPPIRPCEGWNSKNDTDNKGSGGLSDQDSNDPVGRSNLDEATKNFDTTFTSMAVGCDSEDFANGSDSEVEGEELNDSTFVGFTFDEDE